jgi:hypothetical protein
MIILTLVSWGGAGSGENGADHLNDLNAALQVVADDYRQVLAGLHVAPALAGTVGGPCASSNVAQLPGVQGRVKRGADTVPAGLGEHASPATDRNVDAQLVEPGRLPPSRAGAPADEAAERFAEQQFDHPPDAHGNRRRGQRVQDRGVLAPRDAQRLTQGWCIAQVASGEDATGVGHDRPVEPRRVHRPGVSPAGLADQRVPVGEREPVVPGILWAAQGVQVDVGGLVVLLGLVEVPPDSVVVAPGEAGVPGVDPLEALTDDRVGWLPGDGNRWGERQAGQGGVTPSSLLPAESRAVWTSGTTTSTSSPTLIGANRHNSATGSPDAARRAR